MTLVLAILIFLALGPNYMNENNLGMVSSIMLVLIVPLFLIYFSKDSIKGISVGRWIFGIMVRDEKDPNLIPNYRKLLIRNLFLLIWPIEFTVLAVSGDKKRLGDKFAKTRVYNNPQ